MKLISSLSFLKMLCHYHITKMLTTFVPKRMSILIFKESMSVKFDRIYTNVPIFIRHNKYR
jgi:hypothetical protein